MELSSLPLLFLSLLFISLACVRQDDDLSGKSIEEIARLIHEEVGSAEAGSADRCELMPIGIKPAGGPWGYLVFSSEKSDRARLERLVSRYNELDAERNAEDGGFSTADIATRPEISLLNGICTGVGPYAWNRGDILDFNDLDENQ